MLFGKRDQPGCKNPSSCGGFPRIRATVSLLRKLIRTDISARNCFVTKDDICNTADGLDIQKRFPSWMWHAEVREFPWQPTLQPDVLQAVSSVLGNVIVRLFVIFGATFSGKKALTYRFRTLSLLFYFADRGEHWKGVQSRTYRCTNSEDIEACCRHHFFCDEQTFIPGCHDSTWAHKCGRALPKGSIWQARPHFTTLNSRSLAFSFLTGRTRSLQRGRLAQTSV